MLKSRRLQTSAVTSGDEIQTGHLDTGLSETVYGMRHYDEEMATPETIVSNHDLPVGHATVHGRRAGISGNAVPPSARGYRC